MGDKEWCSITHENPHICSECSEPLVPRIGKDLSLRTKVIEKNSLQSYTKSTREKTLYIMRKPA